MKPYKLERKGNDWVWWFKQFMPVTMSNVSFGNTSVTMFTLNRERKPRKWA